MKTSDAIRHFGSQAALAAELDITQPSVAEWGEFPPPLRQLQIEKATQGVLRAESDVLLLPMRQR